MAVDAISIVVMRFHKGVGCPDQNKPKRPNVGQLYPDASELLFLAEINDLTVYGERI